MQSKYCTACGERKLITAFGKQKDSKSGNYYRRAVCRPCRAEKESKRQHEGPVAKAKRREYDLKRNYGITTAQYDAMYEAQGGRCPGCSRHQSEFSTRLAVEHHHETKKIRSLMCSGCNLAIGNVEENPQTLLSLAKYLMEKNDEN